MERIRLAAAALAATLVLGTAAAGAQDGKGDAKKKEAPVAAGPFGLPSLAAVKDKCKPSAEQAPKLEAIYAEGVKNEADTRKRAKEQATEKKELDKFLELGKTDVINKVQDLLDDAQDKIFNDLLKAATPDPKKKKK
jgi:hypothetical protein